MTEPVKRFCGSIAGSGNESFYHEDCLYARENTKHCNAYRSDVHVRLSCTQSWMPLNEMQIFPSELKPKHGTIRKIVIKTWQSKIQ